MTNLSQAVAAEAAAQKHLAGPIGAEMTPFEVFQRVGLLTRKLHDALQALGYYSDVESAVGSLPDARARLDYVATLTGQAAERVLSAAEEGRELQEQMAARARALAGDWKDRSSLGDAALVAATREFMDAVPQLTDATNKRFSDIMLAQDFHDLTGQTIQRVVSLAQTLEEQLVKLLLDATPPEKRATIEPPMLEGPVVNPHARDDVVANQTQVDDLLESLGF